MDINAYREFLLQKLPNATPASGFTEVCCQCFYCNDAGSHHHMYISIPKTDEELSFFNCFKCGTSGVVSHTKLNEWGIFDSDWSIELSSHNKRVLSNPANYKYKDLEIYNLKNNYIRGTELSDIKLRYINERLGCNFSYADIIANKIVLNLNDLLLSNNIKSLTRDIKVVNELNKNFIGFISFDNAFVNLRKINDDSFLKPRYINYNIFNKKDNTKKFYIPPINIDITNPKPVAVHIAEGPFDALSIKYNLRRQYDHNIYCAVTGRGYKTILRNLTINMKMINLDMHLYPDNDTSDDFIDDIKYFLKPYNYPVTIHRNRIGKDMGERMEKIKEIIY